MKEFYFSMISTAEVGNEPWFMLVEKNFYDRIGHLDDNHTNELVLANVTNPVEFEQEFAEECESMYLALNKNRKETLAWLNSQPNFIKKRL